ncbi:MAG: outer membrane lipoprotein carrier protein LolA [Prevotellaceae bacterium]|jgi:outer membrane lipoprotein-sorting protein|nr:outer membrane lipoprotein carrier protein LolA [Prevotellaceae bacterium]
MNKIRIKKMLPAALMLALCTAAAAQDAAPVAEERREAVLQQIAAASAGMKSLSCSFEQTRVTAMLSDKLVSTGRMYYRQEGCLRWEYAPPMDYTFILNNRKALMLAKGRRLSDPKLSRFFREMSDIMVHGVSGSGLSDAQNFDVACYESAVRWEVVLTPRKKELRKMFASITLTFNLKDYTADQIALAESNGDVTTIRLLEKQLNIVIDEAMFNVSINL